MIRPAISSSVSPLRAASTTLAPFLAAVSAVARPMPDDAPVMTMTCWSRGFSFTLMTLLLMVDQNRLIEIVSTRIHPAGDFYRMPRK